jgi:hypothetical protein
LLILLMLKVAIFIGAQSGLRDRWRGKRTLY